MLHNVHHEQRIAVRARIDKRRERGHHRPPQPPGHIRRHVRGRQELQPEVDRPPPPTQLLDHAAQGMPPEQHLHRPIRPHHQQPRQLGPLPQVGEGLDRRMVAPLQVFQDQHQRPVGRQHLQRLGEFTQHVGRRRPLQAALEALQFRLAHQAGEVRQPHGRIAPQHGADRVPLGPAAQPPQAPPGRAGTVPPPGVLHALPLRGPHLAPSGQAGQEELDDRRLPTPASPLTKTSWRVPWAAR